MAARIPQYTPQVGTPSGLVRGAEGRGFRPVEIDLSGFGDFVEGVQRRREETADNNARAELSAEEPKAQLAFATAFSQIQNDWTPDAKPVPEQMTEVIDAYQAEAEKRFTNPRTRELMTARANELKTHYGLQGFAFQQKAEIDNRVGTYESTYQNIANLAATDPNVFGVELAKANAVVMADSQLPEQAKRTFIAEQSKGAAKQVANVQAKVNPRTTLPIVNNLLGVTEPVLTISGGTGNIQADILKRESGGRMFDAAGKLLRGPAITGKDGKQYHAYGKFQLLDSTAREVAKSVGVDWKPDVFYRDKTGDVRLDAETEQYHDLLGSNYIDQQNAAFNGDPVLIAAAHNMGPAATQGWAEGRPYQTQSGRWWYPKAPKDLSAMPEETRKYIAGLGTLTEEPAGREVDTSGENAIAFRLLDAEDLLAVKSAAESKIAAEDRERNAALQVNKDLFKQRITDTEIAAKHGDPVQIPSDGELITYLGPAGAALTKQRLVGYQQMAGALKRIPGLTNAELTATANMPDPEGTEDRQNRQFIRDTMANQAQAVLTARAADPGQAALDTSPGVRTAFGGYQDAAKAFYDAGPQATPEMLAKMNTAQSLYFKTSFAQQRQWGITQPMLPKAVVTSIADGFLYQMDKDPVTAAARMQNLPKELGGYDAVAQVGGKTGDLGWFAMEGVPPQTLVALKNATTLKPEDMAKQLPPGIKRADVNTAVARTFAPLSTTFALPDIDGVGDSVTSNRYLKAGESLAAMRLISGQASSANEAAAQAYQELFADRETVVGTYRVPNTFDAAKVDVGLKRRLASLPPEEMYVATPPPGLTDDEARTHILRNVQRNGRWVTNEDGTGVYLMVAGKPALNASGEPIQAQFEQAVNQPVPEAERYREQARLDSLARGLK